jgi:hypothetical protein
MLGTGPGAPSALEDKEHMMRALTLSLSLVLLACAAGTSLSAQTPAGLELLDLTLGTSSSGGTQATLVPGHAVVLRVLGAPNTVHLLAFSTIPPATGTPSYQGVPVGINASSFALVWNGFVNPAIPPIPPSGQLDIPLIVPPATIGSRIWLQGLTSGLGPGLPLMTNHLELTFGGEPMTTVAQVFFSQHPQAPTPGVMAVSDPAGWLAFWALHSGGATSPPTVDFTTSFVVIAFEGMRVAQQPAFTITAVYQDLGGILQVYTTELLPGIPGPPVVTTSCHMVSVPIAAYSPNLNENRTIIALP